jgi:cytochrome c553
MLIPTSEIPTMTFRPFAILICLFVISPASAQSPDDHFEKKIRPLLLAKCAGCHGPEKNKGGLRLDAAGIAQGGESGPVVVPGKPDESLLVRSVRYDGDLKMPPGGKLKEDEIAALTTWVEAGAIWPNAPAASPGKTASAFRSMEPNAASIRPHLQAWYRADKLPMADGKLVHVWPDSSGKGRDLSATSGVRRGGVGQPGTFVAASTLNRRPAVRFGPETGLASSPDSPPDINGDAALTLFLVLNLRPTDVPHPHDGILGIGNPANSTGDPGKPLAALVMITRHPEPELKLAGGWNHDATLGKSSFASYWNNPVLLTVIRKPGPLRTTTRFFIDGIPSEESPLNRKVLGTDGIPDIQHRDDIGLYLGKALSWCGSIRGDIGEVAVFNSALSDEDRTAVEVSMSDRHGLIHPTVLSQSKATFTPDQKAFWAFQPVKAIAPPAVRDERRVQTPIDRFILARLEAAGVSQSAPTDKRTLMRRVTFDLTGLPPTPEEMDAFEKDAGPDAFEKVVDRLLDSKHYGERWGRHWLDTVRYAETTADDANAVMRYAYRYRDYVVQSFNTDKPYDQFVIEQLAGDLLPTTGDLSRDAEKIIATGFLMLGPKALAEADKEQSRRDIIDDQIDVTGKAFLGLTVSCARCHDHKFDPIPATDYYAFAGVFRGIEVLDGPNPSFWQEFPLLQLPGEKPVMVMAPKEGMPTNLRVALRGNRNTPGVLAPRRFLQIVAGEGHAPITTTQSGRLELARWIASKDNPLTARVMVNRIWQHHFGTGLVASPDNFGVRGERASHPELLDWLAVEFVAGGWSVKKLHKFIILSATYQTGATADAALVKADPNNRLFGRMARRRLDAESLRDAMLFANGRLDLTVGGNESGELLFQKGEVIIPSRDYLRPNQVQSNHPIYTESVRRSLYLPVVRNAVPDVLALFDCADPNAVTAVRNDTTVASQALFLLNSSFVRDQSSHFAKRLLADTKATNADRVVRGFRLAVGRAPEASESEDAANFLSKYEQLAVTKGKKPDEAQLAAWQSFCQTLLCRNEFLYLD